MNVMSIVNGDWTFNNLKHVDSWSKYLCPTDRSLLTGTRYSGYVKPIFVKRRRHVTWSRSHRCRSKWILGCTLRSGWLLEVCMHEVRCTLLMVSWNKGCFAASTVMVDDADKGVLLLVCCFVLTGQVSHPTWASWLFCFEEFWRTHKSVSISRCVCRQASYSNIKHWSVLPVSESLDRNQQQKAASLVRQRER